jgi:hypothetical protein
MTNLQQAAQQALEALEGELWLMLDKPEDEQYRVKYAYLLTVITALRTALEQQAEPVAWAVQACSKMWRGEFAEIDAKAEAKRIGGTCVAYALYTSPPQREWQSLTDEDWEKVVNRKNTVLDTFEQGATWAAYKLERRNT